MLLVLLLTAPRAAILRWGVAPPQMELPAAEELAALAAASTRLSVAVESAAVSVKAAEAELQAAAASRRAARRRDRAASQEALERAQHKRDSEVEAAEVAAGRFADPQLLWQTAETAMLEEKWPAAVSGFVRAAPLHSSVRAQTRCYNAAGVCLLLAVRLKEAIRMLNLAIHMDPHEPRAWHNRAQARFMTRQFSEAVEDATKALSLDATNAASAELLERATRHRDMAAVAPLSMATPAEVGDWWKRRHTAWALEIRQMLSSLVPSPDSEQGEPERSTQIVLPAPTGAALAAAVTATAAERQRADRGIGEMEFLAHRCKRAAASQSQLQVRLDEVERVQLNQLDEMGLNLRTSGRNVTLVAVPQFSSLENDIALGAPRSADDEVGSLASDPDGEHSLSAPMSFLSSPPHADLLLATTPHPTAPTTTMVVGADGIVNSRWDHSVRAQDWRENQALAAEVSALEATHSRLSIEVAVEADQLGVKPPITPWRQRFDTEWQRTWAAFPSRSC